MSMMLGIDYDEDQMDCHDCGLVFDARETEGVCVRCHPQLGRCYWCSTRALLRIVDDGSRGYCSQTCVVECAEDVARVAVGRGA